MSYALRKNIFLHIYAWVKQAGSKEINNNKLYRQIDGIPVGTNCAPLCFYFVMKEMSCLLFLMIIKPISLRHLTRPLDIKTIFLILTILILKEWSTKFIHELKLNKANTSDTEAPFLDLHPSIFNGFVSSKIYDKRDGFDFDIVNFPILDSDVPRRPSYGVYISQLIRFARVCSDVDDFSARNKCLTAKLLK